MNGPTRSSAHGKTAPEQPGLSDVSGKIAPGHILAARYRLEVELGRGSFGAVFRVYDSATQTRVALKVLRPEIAGRRGWWGPIGREVRHAREVVHPNVCRIFELVEADGFTFFTMELATKGTIRTTLGRTRRRPLTSRMADARGVAAGLAAVHAAGLVHRDLKPENILRMQDERLVVSDFGLAEMTSTNSRASGGGTRGYMAPEVVRGDPATMTSDVWSLGIVLHEILFGCRPDSAAVPTTDGAQAGALRTLCLDCTSVEPQSRPADGREVLRRLDELDGEPLDQLLSRQRLSFSDALTLAARLLESLAGKSGMEVITPSRVLVPRRPDLPLRLLDSRDRRSARERQASYSAPERALGEGDHDVRSDVFAVGCILHECLTGKPPKSGLPALHISARRTLKHAQDLPAVPTKVTAPALAFLQRMLDPDRARRPRDVVACAFKLRALAAAAVHAPVKAEAGDLLTNEQKVCAVVRVRLHATGRGGANSEDVRRMQRAVRPFQRRFVHRERGEWLLAFTDAGTPGDAAAKAARCALMVRDSVASASIAVTRGVAVVGAARTVAAVDVPEGVLDGADPGSVRLDESTVRLLGPRFEIARGPVSVLVRELVCDERPRTVLGKEPPLVGRDREIGTLMALWEEVKAESVARAVLVTAPPGAGKSRLRHEFLERVRSHGEGFQYLIGRGDSVRAGAPFSLLGSALPGVVGLLGGEPADVQRNRLLEGVTRRIPAPRARQVAAFLGEICGIPFPDHDLPALRAARQEPHLMADQTLSAWLDFIEAECATHPVLLILEDLHWGDVPSTVLVDAALRNLRDRPLLVLGLARPEIDDSFAGLWVERDLQRLALAPLTARSAHSLVQHICAALSATEVDRIVSRADGNPFHLEELVRAAAEPREAKNASLPATVIGMVQARFDTLGADVKRVLRAAAIFGPTFRAAGVRVVMGSHDKNLDRWLDLLAEKEIVFRRQAAAPEELAFRHALLEEAAYAMVTKEDRVLGHRLAAQYLEAEGEREAIVLVEHYEKGGDHDKAVRWCKVAAEQALDANDLAAVIDRVERGVRLGAAHDTLGAMRAAQAQARFWRGEYRAAELAALEATTLLRGPSRLRAVRDVIASLGQQARFSEVQSWIETVLKEPVEPTSVGPRLECLARAAGYLLPGGLYQAADSLRAEIEANRTRIEPATRARLDGVNGLQAMYDGHAATARELFESACRAFEAIGDVRSLVEMQLNVAVAVGELGLIEEAEAKLSALLARADRIQLHYLALGCSLNLCSLRAVLGHFDGADRAGQDALVLARKQGDVRWEGAAHVSLSMSALWQGRLNEGEEHARAAAILLEAVPATLPFALATLAQALLQQGRRREALALATNAHQRLEQLGAVDDGEALIRLVHAECLLSMGKTDEAREACRAAWERLMKRAATIDHLPWREAFLSRWPSHARTLVLARELGVARQIPLGPDRSSHKRPISSPADDRPGHAARTMIQASRSSASKRRPRPSGARRPKSPTARN